VFPIRDLNPAGIRPWVTYTLIAANVAIFLLWQPQGRAIWETPDPVAEAEFLLAHAVVPCEVTSGDPLTFREVIRGVCDGAGEQIFPDKLVRATPVTSMFLHGGLFHLITNMWVLWIFGNNVEEAFGRGRYLAMYLIAGLVATAAFIALRPEGTTPLVGASGAIAGVLGSYLLLHPRAQVLSLIGFVLLFPLPAWVFLGGWFALQFWNADPSVAWEAHVFGFIVGLVITLLARPGRHLPTRKYERWERWQR
jgi:membrane associated rhomboid family serine protease